jgi:ketosteroid isomerase-like protein
MGSVERELVELERKYWEAMKANDVETAMALTDDPCIVAGPSGVMSVDAARFRAIMQSSTRTIEDIELGDDVKVRLLSDGVAVIAYTIKERVSVDGVTHTLEASDASTWVRRGDGWRCALHTESIAGDPFARRSDY